jgi:polyhydroxyalkanoate synthesis regulator phasin
VPFIEIHDISQVATLLGIIAILITFVQQFRAYKKSQKEEQQKNRTAITDEINSRAGELMEKIEYKLELIKSASVLGKSDLESLRNELKELKSFVDKMDREGTIEWRKVKPFIVERVDQLEKRVDDLERHLPS